MSRTTAAPTPAAPNLRRVPYLTTGQFSRETGLESPRIRALVAEGLPCYQLDARRLLFDTDEAVPWLIEHGHMLDPYRESIKKLVDAAPPLTAEQAAKIRAVLAGSAVA